ncbi:MAG: MFS transporter [Methylotenera sp.]|nr:MFS transporter [Oligoflexia bacterium]
MGQGIVAPQLPELLHGSETLAMDSGLSAVVLYLGIFLASFPFGKASDRGRVHWLLTGGLLAYACTLLAFTLQPDRTALFLIRFFEGVSISAVFVAADYLLGKLSPPDQRGKWLSFYGVALSIGLLLGPLLSLGWHQWISASFAGPLIIVAGLAALSAILSGVSVRVPAAIFGELTQAGRKISLRGNFGPLSAGISYGAMEASLVAVLPVIALQTFHVKPELCLIFVILSAAISSLPWGISSDRFGPEKVVKVLLGVLAIAPLALFVFSRGTGTSTGLQGMPLALLSSLVFGLIAGGLYPVGFSWLLAQVDDSRYGEASGAFTRYYGLGSIIGPGAAGWLTQTQGYSGLLLFLSVLGFFTWGGLQLPGLLLRRRRH